MVGWVLAGGWRFISRFAGELLGGLDIIKEMVESGDLQKMIPVKISLDDRLQSLTHSHPVMVFMKGVPSAPQVPSLPNLLHLTLSLTS